MSRVARLTAQRRRLLSRVVVLASDVGRYAEAGLRDRFDGTLTQNVTIIVLSHLHTSGPSRPRALRRAVGFTSGGTSNLLSRLEAAGLIRRTGTSVDDDDRAVLVELTDLGERTHQALVDGLLDGLRQAAAVLKELQLTLEHLGASPRRASPAVAAGGTGSLLVRALADVGERLMVALDTGRSDFSASMVLIAIGDIGPCRPRYLADRLAMSTAGIAKLLDRLESEQRVRRNAGAVALDRRAVLVELTAGGRTALDEILNGVAERLDPLAEAVFDVGDALGLSDDADRRSRIR